MIGVASDNRLPPPLPAGPIFSVGFDNHHWSPSGRYCAVECNAHVVFLLAPIVAGFSLGRLQPLREHDNLSSRLVLLHAAMRLNDVVKMKYLPDLNVQRALRDLIGQFLKGHSHKVF